MAKIKVNLKPLDYMRISIEVMKSSIQEARGAGEVSPMVGAVLVRPDGSYITACRGELREGEHAEYTLLERKCFSENLKGCVLYSNTRALF